MLYRRIRRFVYHLFNKKTPGEKIHAEKNLIRRQVRAAKSNLTDEYKQTQADRIFSIIESMDEFQKARTLLMYWSVSDELPTHEFIKKWSKKKQILLPVVKGEHMTTRPFTSESDMKEGKWTTMEPSGSKDYLRDADLIIIPGMAFDHSKRRLGRGKGYYDRYLKRKSIPKWGICFDFQLFNEIPATSHDIMMDKIITASKIIS